MEDLQRFDSFIARITTTESFGDESTLTEIEPMVNSLESCEFFALSDDSCANDDDLEEIPSVDVTIQADILALECKCEGLTKSMEALELWSRSHDTV